MGYELGVDLGATTVAAAVTADSRVQMVDLGAAAATVPAVVFLEDDGSLICGVCRTRTDPREVRVVRNARRGAAEGTHPDIDQHRRPRGADVTGRGDARGEIDREGGHQGCRRATARRTAGSLRSVRRGR